MEILKKKKGQVTLFVIIAILIVVGAGIFYFIKSDILSGDAFDVSILKTYADDCINKNIDLSINVISQGGGYFYPPANSHESGFTYYYYEGNKTFPSKENIEAEFSKHTGLGIDICLREFNSMPQYKIERRACTLDTNILENNLEFNVECPIMISSETDSVILKDFGKFKREVNFGQIYSIISELIDNNLYSDDFLCLNCITDAVYESGFSIDFLEGGENGSLFVVKDYDESTDKTLKFAFALK